MRDRIDAAELVAALQAPDWMPWPGAPPDPAVLAFVLWESQAAYIFDNTSDDALFAAFPPLTAMVCRVLPSEVNTPGARPRFVLGTFNDETEPSLIDRSTSPWSVQSFDHIADAAGALARAVMHGGLVGFDLDTAVVFTVTRLVGVGAGDFKPMAAEILSRAPGGDWLDRVVAAGWSPEDGEAPHDPPRTLPLAAVMPKGDEP